MIGCLVEPRENCGKLVISRTLSALSTHMELGSGARRSRTMIKGTSPKTASEPNTGMFECHTELLNSSTYGPDKVMGQLRVMPSPRIRF